MDCSPPGSSVHGILQARILEWGAISFSRGSSWPRDQTQVSHISGRHFNLWATREVLSTTWLVHNLRSDSFYPQVTGIFVHLEVWDTYGFSRTAEDCILKRLLLLGALAHPSGLTGEPWSFGGTSRGQGAGVSGLAFRSLLFWKHTALWPASLQRARLGVREAMHSRKQMAESSVHGAQGSPPLFHLERMWQRFSQPRKLLSLPGLHPSTNHHHGPRRGEYEEKRQTQALHPFWMWELAPRTENHNTTPPGPPHRVFYSWKISKSLLKILETLWKNKHDPPLLSSL